MRTTTDVIKAAFLTVRNQWSLDRIIADPELDAAFITECRRLELTGSDFELNWKLINLRKRGDLAGIASKRTVIKNQDEFQFASEIASRFLERRDGISIDRIFCDPVKASEFDQLAAQMSPGYSTLEYRWAALALRKKKRLKPEIVSRVLPSTSVTIVPVKLIELAKIPLQQGLYLFYESKQTLYVGEANNLQKRMKKHLDHSDNKGLARWLWDNGSDGMFLEFHTLPEATTSAARRSLELELIHSRSPIFNVAGVE